jgi:hypothetical protein
MSIETKNKNSSGGSESEEQKTRSIAVDLVTFIFLPKGFAKLHLVDIRRQAVATKGRDMPITKKDLGRDPRSR